MLGLGGLAGYATPGDGSKRRSASVSLVRALATLPVMPRRVEAIAPSSVVVKPAVNVSIGLEYSSPGVASSSKFQAMPTTLPISVAPSTYSRSIPSGGSTTRSGDAKPKVHDDSELGT